MWSQTFSDRSHSVKKITLKKKHGGAAHSETKEEEKEKEEEDSMIDEPEGGGVPAKKARSLCKYLTKWEEAYAHLRKSYVCQSNLFCKICHRDFGVSHGGKSDASQHEKSAKHKRKQEAQKQALPMTTFITRNISEAEQETKSELKMSVLWC